MEKAKVKITQTASTIKCTKRQKLTIKALGLGRINKHVSITLTPQIEGMVHQVSHLIHIQPIL